MRVASRRVFANAVPRIAAEVASVPQEVKNSDPAPRLTPSEDKICSREVDISFSAL